MRPPTLRPWGPTGRWARGSVRTLVWGRPRPALLALPGSPSLPLAGARVQPDRDRLLFCVKKSIIPAMSQR